MSFKTMLVAGASRGIGLAASDHFVSRCDRLLAVSRPAAEVLADLAADNHSSDEAISLADLLSIIDCILSLSRATCLKEIDVPAMLGTGA